MAFPSPVDSPYMMTGECLAMICLKQATAFSVSYPESSYT